MDFGEYADAQKATLDAIDIIHLDQDHDPALLIEAFTGLGNARAAAGDYWLALAAFEEASNLSRREDGLFNADVVEILVLMQQTARAGGDFELTAQYGSEAQRIARRALEEQVRGIGESRGEDSLEYLNAKLKLARWLARQPRGGPPRDRGRWMASQEAREAYLDTLKLIRKEFDDDPELNVQVLRMMATDIGFVTPLGEPLELVRAERVVKRMADPDPVLHAVVLRDVGDWRLSANLDKAEKAYREAWERLEGAEDGRDLQREFFDEPELIRQVMPMGLYGIITAAPDAPAGQVELEFVVDASGRARMVQVVNADPQWAGDAAVSLLAWSLFRPRLEDGKFVAAPSRFTWNFRYDRAVAASLGLTGNGNAR